MPHPPMLGLAVLAVAEAAPVSGKAFCEKVAMLTAGSWRISPGTIYPLLQKMEKDGLLKCEISPAKGRGRRELAYALTVRGKAFLAKARAGSREFATRMMGRMVPVSTFVCFGHDDPELLAMLKKVREATNAKVWRAAAHGKETAMRELEKLLAAVEKA